MLRDIFIKDNKQRDDLQYSTARALTLGNDITAFGHSVTFVEDTARSAQDAMASYARMPAIYPAQALLDQLQAQQTIKQRVKEHLTHKPTSVIFWAYYKALRQRGVSRREILTTVCEAIQN